MNDFDNDSLDFDDHFDFSALNPRPNFRGDFSQHHDDGFFVNISRVGSCHKKVINTKKILEQISNNIE